MLLKSEESGTETAFALGLGARGLRDGKLCAGQRRRAEPDPESDAGSQRHSLSQQKILERLADLELCLKESLHHIDTYNEGQQQLRTSWNVIVKTIGVACLVSQLGFSDWSQRGPWEAWQVTAAYWCVEVLVWLFAPTLVELYPVLSVGRRRKRGGPSTTDRCVRRLACRRCCPRLCRRKKKAKGARAGG